MRGHAGAGGRSDVWWNDASWLQGIGGEEGCERRASLCQDQPVLWATKGGTHSASAVPTVGQRQCHRGGTQGEVVFLNNVPGRETAANQRSVPDRNMDRRQEREREREMEALVCDVFLSDEWMNERHVETLSWHGKMACWKMRSVTNKRTNLA